MYKTVIYLCAFMLLGMVISPVMNAAEKNKKPGIILVAFGTSVPEARKVFDHINASARKRFPGHDILWGFTAKSIIKKLRKEGTGKDALTLEEAIAEMKKRGHTSIVLQSLHVVPGQKDKEMGDANTLGMHAALGRPLLSCAADINQVSAALKKNISTNCPNVLAGHGNDHHPEFNKQLVAFAKKAESEYKNTWLCSVEGKPGSDALGGEIKKAVAAAGGKVNFIPFMIVAGDHIMNDVAGAEPEAWKNVVKAKKVTVQKPLGYNDAVLAIFWEHLDSALKALELQN